MAPSDTVERIVLGSVCTADPGRPAAGGVAVGGGRILAVGSREEIRALARPGVVVDDVGPGGVLPGFRDAHVHLAPLGRRRGMADLHGLDLAGVRHALARHAATLPAAAWVEGAGWSLDLLGTGRMPRASDLAGLTGGRPALLVAHDFHTAVLNPEGTALLRAAGADGPGGGPGVERDADGAPSGLLREKAVFAAASWVAAAEPASARRDAVLRAAAALLARGITAADDMDGLPTLRVLRALRDAGELPLRAVGSLRGDDLREVEGRDGAAAMRAGSVPVGGVKLFLDGALGSRTAWMLDPYEDGDRGTGSRELDAEALAHLVRRAAALGLPCRIHAIGDAAVRAALDGLAAAPALPHRVEHAQCVHPDDLPRFRAQGVVASVQPSHLHTDLPVAERAWGARGARTFPLRGLVDAGADVRLGSDAPVEEAEPLHWIHAAAERTTRDGRPAGGWHPAQRLTRAEAVARAAAAPLRPGGPADLVAYPEDPLAVPAARLLALRPVLVLLGGVPQSL